MPILDWPDIREEVKGVATVGMMWTGALIIENAPEASTGSSVTLICGSLGAAVEAPRLPFKGRKTVESYDPASWPYPREEAAEREWDEDEAEG